MPKNSYPGPDTIKRYSLNNGITVLVYENSEAQTVVVDGLIRAGAIVEKREVAGLASFTAEMLTRGTEQRTFDEIYEAIEAVGAGVDLGGGRHVTDFSAHCLTEDLDLILAILSESIRHPVFPEEQVDRVRGEIIAGLQIRANDTRQMASLKFRELLYGHHPYGQSVEGYLDSVSQLSRESMVDYHQEYYGPQDMIITVVGSIEPELALEKVRVAFGDWRSEQKSLPDAPPANQPGSKLRIQADMPEKTQADIMMGVPGPLRSATDYLEASIANTILGVFGMYGRLGKNVRESQGLAYYSYSQLYGGLGPSPWYISTGVAPENVEVAVESILFEVERLLVESIPEEELADTQAFRSGALPVSLETVQGIANVLTDIELFDLGLDYLQTLPDRIFAMTPETVQAAARNYLSSEQIAIAVAGP